MQTSSEVNSSFRKILRCKGGSRWQQLRPTIGSRFRARPIDQRCSARAIARSSSTGAVRPSRKIGLSSVCCPCNSASQYSELCRFANNSSTSALPNRCSVPASRSPCSRKRQCLTCHARSHIAESQQSRRDSEAPQHPSVDCPDHTKMSTKVPAAWRSRRQQP